VAVYQNQKLKTYDGRIVVEAARKLAPKDGENRTFDEVNPAAKHESDPWTNWMRPAPTRMIE